MKAFPAMVILIILASSVLLTACTSTAPVTDPQLAEMEAVAKDLTTSIDAGLADIRAGNWNASRALSTTNLSGVEAEAVLSENLMHSSWALSSVVISPKGIVLAAVPENYAGIVGADLSDHSFFQEANASQAPMVSEVFRLAEGFDAIAQSYPVFSPAGEYLGYTDITYEPYTFLNRHVEKVTSGTPYDAWVAQTDGTVIYDIHKEEIGTNILTDPAYGDSAMHETFMRIAREPGGSGTYSFHDDSWNGTVTKTAVWDTAGIDGAEWRVVVTSTESKGAMITTPLPVTTRDATGARYANLTTFVQKAAAYAKQQGKETALQEFNNPNGSFIDGELYVFAYEMNGTVIALPYQRGLLGTDRSGISDSNGVEFIKGLSDVARNGGGSLYYIYPNPEDNYRDEFKISSVMPVGSEWFVGSGIYMPEIPASFNMTDRDELVDRVKQARRYAQEQGSKKAISDFNDRNGTFADGNRYIFAYAFNGTTLALPFQPELIGTNRMNFSDPYGVNITAWLISTAQRGGGFAYVDYLNPETGATGLKLCYVAPVDNEWFVGSGIYTEGI